MKRPDVVGTAEAARILKVPTPVVNRKKNAGKMPPPAANGAATTLWHRADVERLAEGGDVSEFRSRPLDLVGTSEVAVIASVNKSQIGRWKRKNPRFPPPAVEVAAGPFWWRRDIERFVEDRSTERVPAAAS